MIVRTSTQRAATHSGFFNRQATHAAAVGFVVFGILGVHVNAAVPVEQRQSKQMPYGENAVVPSGSGSFAGDTTKLANVCFTCECDTGPVSPVYSTSDCVAALQDIRCDRWARSHNCLVTVNCPVTCPTTEFSWAPVDASAPFSTAGGEMILPACFPYIVEFELRVSGWAKATGSPTLGAVQAGVNADGFLGANAIPSNAGVDLSVLSGVAWQENQSVSHGGLFDGAHIITNTCEDLIAGNIDLGIPCGSIPGTHTWGGCGINPGTGNPTFCTPNPEFVFSTNLAVGSVATAVANIVWGGVSTAGVCTMDDGGTYYLGTLILNVPASAEGSYTFGFDPSISTTFMNDCGGSQISGVGRTQGSVTLLLTEVPPGPDSFRTECGGTKADFCIDPIPADFFDPGSLPFGGIVTLEGAGGPDDTIVERLETMTFRYPLCGVATTDIKLTDLHLKSCEPIVVRMASEWGQSAFSH